MSAFQVDAKTFDTSTLLWDAQSVYESQGYQRQVLTYNRQYRQGVAFQWPDQLSQLKRTDLSQEQLMNLILHAGGTTDMGQGKAMVQTLRAEPVAESLSTDNLRLRNNLMGDILNSDPLHVGRPNQGYQIAPITENESINEARQAYLNFAHRQANRTPMLLVGSNNGMLHVLNASAKGPEAGKEIFAYIPDAVFDRLGVLTDPLYAHDNFMNGKITAGDVYFRSAANAMGRSKGWHTLAVGLLGNGGQAAFVLDITDPDAISESTAKEVVLTEFSDKDDPDMGFPLGKASIGQLANGDWVAAFGNGFGNTEEDGKVSLTGNAILYLLNLETGAITKLGHGRGFGRRSHRCGGGQWLRFTRIS